MNAHALDLHTIARALGGTVSGEWVRAPAPGHSARDRSLSIKLDPAFPEGFWVEPFAGEDPIAVRDYVRQRIGLGPWTPEHRTESNIGRMSDRARQRNGGA